MSPWDGIIAAMPIRHFIRWRLFQSIDDLAHLFFFLMEDTNNVIKYVNKFSVCLKKTSIEYNMIIFKQYHLFYYMNKKNHKHILQKKIYFTARKKQITRNFHFSLNFDLQKQK